MQPLARAGALRALLARGSSSLEACTSASAAAAAWGGGAVVGQQQEQQQNEQQQHSIQSPLPSAWRSYVNPTRAVAPAGTSVDISEEWYNRQRQKIVLGDRVPYVHSGAWASPSATIVGDVDVHERVSIWNHVVLRGDLNNITIGPVTNIQDRTVVHAARTSPTGLSAATIIYPYVTVEPNCTLRSCRIQDHCIVGARSVLMEGSMMESYSVLAPGSVLPPARRVPAGELYAGNPARFVRKLTEDELQEAEALALEMWRLAAVHRDDELPYTTAWRGVERQRAAQVKAGLYGFVDLRGAKYQLRAQAEADAAARRLK